MSLTILLPTYNEEENIGKMIDDIRAVSKNYDIVVVDSGSEDNTQKIAKQKKAKLIVINKRGKGLAVKHALDRLNSDYLIILDSDLSYPPTEIPKVLFALKRYDVVLGSRFKGSVEHGAMTSVNAFGNKFLTMLAHLVHLKQVSDVCTGMWGFTKKAYKSMVIDAPHFELEANFFIEAVKKNMKICEVPIAYKKRGGKSKLSIKDGFKIAMYLLKRRFD